MEYTQAGIKFRELDDLNEYFELSPPPQPVTSLISTVNELEKNENSIEKIAKDADAVVDSVQNPVASLIPSDGLQTTNASLLPDFYWNNNCNYGFACTNVVYSSDSVSYNLSY